MKNLFKTLFVALLVAGSSLAALAQAPATIYVSGRVVSGATGFFGRGNQLVHFWTDSNAVSGAVAGSAITDSMGYFNGTLAYSTNTNVLIKFSTNACGRNVTASTTVQGGQGPSVVLRVCDTTPANPCANTPAPVISVQRSATYAKLTASNVQTQGFIRSWTINGVAAGAGDSITVNLSSPGAYVICATNQLAGTNCVATACTTLTVSNPVPSVGRFVGTFSSSPAAAGSTVELIKIADSTSSLVLTGTVRVDSVFFPQVPNGTYLVRIIPTSALFAQGFAVSYYTYTQDWTQATPISIQGTTERANLSLFLADSLLFLGGAGQINGTVSGGGSNVNPSVRSAQQSIVFNVARAAVYVQNTANGTSRSTMADASGNYSISNLPMGTYKVTVDYPRVLSTSHMVTLTAAVPVYTANFNTTQATVATGVKDRQLGGLKTYPNPVRDQLTVELASQATPAIAIVNSLGQRFAADVRVENGRALINTSRLATGLYRIQLMQDGATTTASFVKE